MGSGFQRNPIRIGYFLPGPLPFRQGTGVISSKWLFGLQENRRETSEMTKKWDVTKGLAENDGILQNSVKLGSLREWLTWRPAAGSG